MNFIIPVNFEKLSNELLNLKINKLKKNKIKF